MNVTRPVPIARHNKPIRRCHCRRTSLLCISKLCSFRTRNFSLQIQLANVSSLNPTKPLRTMEEFEAPPELRLGNPPMPGVPPTPEYEFTYVEPDMVDGARVKALPDE